MRPANIRLQTWLRRVSGCGKKGRVPDRGSRRPNSDVAKSYTLDLKMELGQVAEVVQVEAGAHVELQPRRPVGARYK